MTSQNKTAPTYDEPKGRTPEEYQRLRRQAQVWEPATMRVLREAGLRKGMSCLDVGCGPGEVMRLMGELVGHIGEPDGTDVAGTIGSLKEYGWLVSETYRNLLPRAIQMGLTTETESKTFLEKLSQAEKSDRYYSILLPSVIGVWKRQPLN
jgi:hypothetical protein